MTKKKYLKPTVSTVEMDSDIIRMLTKQGFVDLFWEKLCEARKDDAGITHEAIFNSLNEKYTSVIGCTRYSDFESFRRGRDRK